MPQAETSQVHPPQRAFVGREREMAEMRAGLEDTTSDRGRLFLVSGEPGIGKTRLVEEVASLAASRGTRVVWGRCWEGGGVPAYWPWVQVLRALLADSDFKMAKVTASAELAQLIPELRASSEIPNIAAQSARPDPEQARFQLFDSVTSLLRNAARRRPLMLVLDDLHDADQPSLLMLQFLARELGGSRIVLVGTYREIEVRRSSELSKLIGEILRDGHQLPLAGLSREEVARMIENYAGKAVGAALVSELHRATLGNPLFVDGVVRVLRAEGRLHEVLDLARLKLPDGAREAIRRRLGLLSAEAYSMLTVAAFIGQEFNTYVLERIPELAVEQLSNAAQEAVAVALVTPLDHGHYRFAHPLIREALYQHPPAAERIRLHRRIGETMEHLYRTDLGPHVGALAHHFFNAVEGGDAEKAIDYLVRAGAAAFAVFAYEEAASHFQAALGLMEETGANTERKADLLERLSRVTYSIDEVRSVGYLEQALRLYEALKRTERLVVIHTEIGLRFSHHTATMSIPGALKHLGAAEAALGEPPELQARGLLDYGISLAAERTLQTDKGLAASSRAMEIADRVRDRGLWSLAARSQALHLLYAGRLAEGFALMDQAWRAADNVDHRGATYGASHSGGGMRAFLYDPREGLSWYMRELGRPRTARSPFFSTLFSFCAGEIYTITGQLTEARRLLDQGEESAPELAWHLRAWTALFDGKWERAERIWTGILDWFSNAGARAEGFNFFPSLAWARRLVQKYSDAEALLLSALAICGGDTLRTVEMVNRPELTLLYADTNRHEEAKPHLARCREIMAAGEDWRGLAGHVARAEAVIAAADGDLGGAEARFDNAIRIFRRYQVPFEEAEALYYWGHALLSASDSQRAGQKFDAAIDIYQRHGAGARWIERVNTARDRAAVMAGAIESRPSISAAPDVGVFRKEGDVWTITYGGRTFRLHDMKGLAYIAHLLAHPGERIHVFDLLATVEGGAAGEGRIRMVAERARQDGLGVMHELGDAGEALDLRARAEYRGRMGELRAEVEDAERQNDPGSIERARAELEFLTTELAAAVGRGGRGRRTAAHAERARATVTKSIRASLERIGRNDAKLGDHFATCIRTGYLCAYLPDPERKPSWRI
jgi:tetratricopeptide (TPR) repeat protein